MHQDRETLGQHLKRERESHRVPIQEIALFVGGNRTLIDALERDDFDAFTRRTECVRLVKQYTTYLKLNQKEVLRLFDAQWKITGGGKQYPKLTQFAEGDSFPFKSFIFKGKRLRIGRSPLGRILLSVVVGALIVISVLFIDLPDIKREVTPPGQPPPSKTAIEVLPAKQHVPQPAAATDRRSVSPKQISVPEAPHPMPGVDGGKIPAHPKGAKVIGNRDSKRYHLPGMKYYALVKAYHRVVFQSEKEAIRAGYSRARE